MTTTYADRADPPLVRTCAADAHKRLREAAEQSIPIPEETTATLIATARALDTGGLTAAQEERFWKAYAYVRTNIFDLRRVRRLYNVGFIALLLVLLAVQSLYISATSLIDAVKAQWAVVMEYEIGQTDSCRQRAAPHLAEAGKEAPSRPSARHHPALGPDGCPTRPVSQPEYEMAIAKLLGYDHLLKTNKALFPWSGSGRDESAAPASREALPQFHHFVSLGALANTRQFLELFILPALYGALGACAFVLRRFTQEQKQGAILTDSGIRYGLRISIGVIAGLAVHWVIRPDEGLDAAHASATITTAVTHMSRYALSFLGGYGSEVVFDTLDRMVSALVPEPKGRTARPPAPTDEVV